MLINVILTYKANRILIQNYHTFAGILIFVSMTTKKLCLNIIYSAQTEVTDIWKLVITWKMTLKSLDTNFQLMTTEKNKQDIYSQQ